MQASTQLTLLCNIRCRVPFSVNVLPDLHVRFDAAQVITARSSKRLVLLGRDCKPKGFAVFRMM
jgi:hypothetical protein|eukprot:COSAG01_NODE_9097_length_2557_cov_5.644426_2_plen_64_part_00